eukprot:8366707-Ditylum_brightwellii.AAC.1
MLMFALWWREKIKREECTLSCNRKEFFNSLPDHLKARLSHKLGRVSVWLPPLLPWQKLFFGSHDPTLITTIGSDHKGFEWVLDHFKGPYNHNTGLGKYDYAIQRKQDPKKGKPRLLDAKDCLGLILMWTCTRGLTW